MCLLTAEAFLPYSRHIIALALPLRFSFHVTSTCGDGRVW